MVRGSAKVGQPLEYRTPSQLGLVCGLLVPALSDSYPALIPPLRPGRVPAIRDAHHLNLLPHDVATLPESTPHHLKRLSQIRHHGGPQHLRPCNLRPHLPPLRRSSNPPTPRRRRHRDPPTRQHHRPHELPQPRPSARSEREPRPHNLRVPAERQLSERSRGRGAFPPAPALHPRDVKAARPRAALRGHRGAQVRRVRRHAAGVPREAQRGLPRDDGDGARGARPGVAQRRRHSSVYGRDTAVDPADAAGHGVRLRDVLLSAASAGRGGEREVAE